MSDDLILPTDEQVERALAELLRIPGHFPDKERYTFTAKAILTILLNKNKILGLDTLT